jgi:peptidoglycan/LPS O-acetylase OafA/YrhL
MADRSRVPHAYRPDIDGLRAVAVIAVVIYHAFPRMLGGGFVGVDVFFVISGFLISGIVLNGLSGGTFTFAEFYRRRIRRIFPALTIVLIALLALGWFVMLPDEYRQLGKHAAASAGFVSNIVLWKEAGYFDTVSTRKPLLHLWSLGIEEQFYFAWPLCLVLLHKRVRSLLPGVTILAVLSFALNIALMRNPGTSFYLPFTRFWELLLGCILTLTGSSSGCSGIRLSRHSDGSPALRNAFAAAGASLMLAALLILADERRFPGWWALLPTFGAASLILAGPRAWINDKVLSAPSLVFVGLISYPLYLWHWPLLSFARILGVDSTGARLALIGLSAILSWVTWKYVEMNVRRRRLRKDIAILAAGLALTGMLGAAMFATQGIAGRRHAVAASAALADINRKFHPTVCSVRPRTFDICSQSIPGKPQALVFGDSHADMLLAGLAAADPGRVWLAAGSNGCPPVLGIVADNAFGVRCDRAPEIIDYLNTPGAPRLVVLSFFGYYEETTDFAADHIGSAFGPSHFRLLSGPPGRSKQDSLALGLGNTISMLVSQGKRVILAVDVPELPFFPRDCLMRPFGRPADCKVDQSVIDRRQRGMREIASRLQREFPGMDVFDPLPVLSDERGFDPVHQDYSLYRDSHHLSVKGSEKVAKALVAMIDASEDSGAER